jgi:sRNA-binding regulator protein Hfq
VPSGSSPQNSQTNSQNLHFQSSRKFLKTTKISLTCVEIFMQNGKVGKGDVFSQEDVFIALFA